MKPGVTQEETVKDARQEVTEWMRLFGQSIWVYVYSCTRNEDTADDLTQEVFLRAYRHAATFRGQSSVKTWLLAIARNAVRDHTRSAFIRKVQLVDDLEPLLNAVSITEEEEIEDLWPLVMQLKAEDREILVLRLREEMTFLDIADMTKLSEGALRVRYQRALSRLRKLVLKGGSFGA